MSATNPYDSIMNNKIFTATKEELTLMLYDGALKFCNQAMMALENKEIEKCGEMIIRVENIILEFKRSLDRKYDISKNLAKMYDYMYTQLVEANIKKDPEILSEVRDLLREFRDMWKQAMKISRTSPAMPAAAGQKPAPQK